MLAASRLGSWLSPSVSGSTTERAAFGDPHPKSHNAAMLPDTPSIQAGSMLSCEISPHVQRRRKACAQHAWPLLSLETPHGGPATRPRPARVVKRGVFSGEISMMTSTYERRSASCQPRASPVKAQRPYHAQERGSSTHTWGLVYQMRGGQPQRLAV